MLSLPNTRNDLGVWLKAQGCAVGAEIGVEQGKFAETLCCAGLELLCVDQWTAETTYRSHLTQADWDRLYASARARLAQYRASLWKYPSVYAATRVPNQSLDFVYIDAKHDEASVRADIAAWLPKVKPGGILAGHDYNLPGVRAAVWAVFDAPMHVTAERSSTWICRA